MKFCKKMCVNGMTIKKINFEEALYMVGRDRVLISYFRRIHNWRERVNSLFNK
jgi:hypothetical protein